MKQKWERTKTGAKLVRTEVLGSTRKLKRGASYKRADGRKGKATSEAQARRFVEASPDTLRTAQALFGQARPAKLPAKKSTRSSKPVASKLATPRAEAPAHYPALTAANLYREAAALPASARFHRAVFLGPLLQRFGTTAKAAAPELWRLFQNDEITLSRADLVDAMDPELVRSSEIEKHGARFHLLRPQGE